MRQLPISWYCFDQNRPGHELTICFTGLPAFKPGEKVEIDFGMDDI
jgi:hypothetical protein